MKSLRTLVLALAMMAATITPAAADSGAHYAEPQGPADCSSGWICLQMKCTHHGCFLDWWYI